MAAPARHLAVVVECERERELSRSLPHSMFGLRFVRMRLNSGSPPLRFVGLLLDDLLPLLREFERECDVERSRSAAITSIRPPGGGTTTNRSPGRAGGSTVALPGT